jgi:hypothetical protein
LPVALGAVAAGEFGDLDGEVVCAAAGTAKSTHNAIVAKKRFGLIVIPPLPAFSREDMAPSGLHRLCELVNSAADAIRHPRRAG